MYDVLFIDDNFEEIKDIYLDIQMSGRCYYCNGINLPSENEQILFRNLKYICLDLRLDNVISGNFILNKSNYSLLVGILRKFNPPKTTNIIINSGELETFNCDDFKKYLNEGFQDMTVFVEEKEEHDDIKFSLLKMKKDEIIKNSKKAFLRNTIIETTVNIENLLWDRIKIKINTQISKKNLDSIFYKHFKSARFCDKIILHDIFDNNLTKDLDQLRKIRNDQAHGMKPLTITEKELFDLMDKLLKELG